MPSKEYAERVSRALEGTGLAEPRSASFGESRIAVLCRVQKENEARWLDLLTKILTGSDISSKTATPWQCHICRHYFLKETSGEHKLVWGWNFSIQARDMPTALDSIISLLKGQPLKIITNELEEFPLPGAPADRNVPRNGRGVHTIGGGQDFHVGRK